MPRFAWLALLIVAVSAVLLLVSRESERPSPSAASYGPTGTLAFARLLEQSGYRVRLERSTAPRLIDGELAIAFFLERPSIDWRTDPLADSIDEALDDFVFSGGNAISTYITSDAPPPVTTPPSLVKSTTDDRKRSLITKTGWAGYDFERFKTAFDAWEIGSMPYVTLYSHGKGAHATVADGYAATNRFIDKWDCAEFWLELVSSVAEPGSTVVFIEAAAGNMSAPSVMERLGNWALLAWWQLLLLGIVIAVTLGKSFGLPPFERVSTKGSRDMADAVRAILARSKRHGTAARLIRQQADRVSRSKPHLGPPPDLSEGMSASKDLVKYAESVDRWMQGG